MVRGTRIWKAAALLALVGCLWIPASAALGDGPVATKSGALINYVSLAKLKIAKKIQILVVCSANCTVSSSSTLKGPGFNQPVQVAGSLNANVPGGPFFQPNGALLKSMKASPGRYKVISSLTATNPANGATDTISHVFRLKR